MKKTMIIMLMALSVSAFAQNSEKQTSYFEKRLNEVNSLVQLSKNQELELTSIYQDLCKTKPDNDGQLLFTIALSRVIKSKSTIQLIYQKEIEQYVTSPVSIKNELNRINAKGQFTDKQLKSLEELIIERKRAFKILDFIYPDNPEGKIAEEKALKELYRKKFDISFIHMGVRNELMNSVSALKYIKQLSLTNQQIDTLCALAWKLNVGSPEALNNQKRSVIVNNKTKEVLSNEQYEMLIDCKVKDSGATDKNKIKQELNDIKSKKRLTNEQADLLEALILEKRVAYIRNEFKYPDNLSQERINADKALKNIYERKFNGFYMNLGLSNIITNNVTALKYKKELSLTPQQEEELSTLGLDLNKKTADTIQTTKKNILEYKRTQEILTPKQFDDFLRLKVKNNVQKVVKSTWTDMKKVAMTAELDSATTCNTLETYYTERAITKEKYGNMENGAEERNIKLQNLKTMEPAVLKKLHALKNRDSKKTSLQPNALTW